MGISGGSRVSESSEHEEEIISTPSLEVETKTPANFNYTELYDDMAIPASMEEVIAVVTTAQPTITGNFIFKLKILADVKLDIVLFNYRHV